MGDMGIGAGIGALAFWGFVAVCVVAGIWDGIRRREAQHETLRKLIDSGQTLDQTTINTILNGGRRAGRDLRTAGLVVLFTAPGLAVLGWFVSALAAWALPPLLGAAVLVGLLGLGLIAAAKAAEKRP